MTPTTPVVPGFALPVTEYAKNQPQYRTLPAHRQPDGTVTSRWRLTLWERVRVFLSGDLWIQQATFNEPLQPIKPSANCPIINYALDREMCG